MTICQAFGPISVRLENKSLSHEEFSICRYDETQLDTLLKDDREYWSKVHFSLSYKSGFWIKVNYEVSNDESAWEQGLNRINTFLEALGLFKSSMSLLAVAGLCVKIIKPGKGGHFGLENTIVGRPHYFLKADEHEDFIELLSKYEEFWKKNKINVKSSEQLKRIGWAKYYFLKTFQTVRLLERYIFLSLALECLFGEGQHELKYRYSNRAAVLLGNDVERRKTVFNDVKKAYDTRSKILHGGITWKIESKDVLTFIEIIRQSILRCISLHSQDYKNITKILDECVHDPTKHEKILNDACSLFGISSRYKKPGKLFPSRKWAIRE